MKEKSINGLSADVLEATTQIGAAVTELSSRLEKALHDNDELKRENQNSFHQIHEMKEEVQSASNVVLDAHKAVIAEINIMHSLLSQHGEARTHKEKDEIAKELRIKANRAGDHLSHIKRRAKTLHEATSPSKHGVERMDWNFRIPFPDNLPRYRDGRYLKGL